VRFPYVKSHDDQTALIFHPSHKLAGAWPEKVQIQTMEMQIPEASTVPNLTKLTDYDNGK
jgi:hypothetical protein